MAEGGIATNVLGIDSLDVSTVAGVELSCRPHPDVTATLATTRQTAAAAGQVLARRHAIRIISVSR